MMTLLSFLFALAILIVVHEYGHYRVARACGVKVLRFSVGFGKVIARRTDRHGTEWALSAIPLGGYVKMVDEREGDVAPEDLPYAFNRKPVLQRMAIVVAGPLANFILAILLYWALFMHGIMALKPIIGAPPEASPAYVAGLRDGDSVRRINGEPVVDWQDVHWLALKHGVGGNDLAIEAEDTAGHLKMLKLNAPPETWENFEQDPLKMLGLLRFEPEIDAVLGQITPDSPAAKAGLRSGDHILMVDGVAVAGWRELVEAIRARPGQPLRLELQRGGQTLAVSVTPESVKDTQGIGIGRIGAGPKVDPAIFEKLQIERSYGPLEGMRQALSKTWDLSAFSLKMLGRMIVGEASLKNLSGPITIADFAGKSAEAGLAAFVGFLALVSVSLGVLNLLPVPLLDGGHLLYYSAELATGRPVSENIQAVGQKIGAALLAALMFFALFNDFQRLFTG
ncbi:MAG: RIP metalloprotease RseP [Hydrogenophilales bacterium]|nr:RIP metalloprotease RseP [Hydrogenophilales bacterium]